MPFLIAIVGNAIGLLVAVWLIPRFIPDGITFTGNFLQLLIAGAVIGIVNGILRPIIRLLSLPLLLVTAGLFGIIINLGLVWFADFLLDDLSIHGIVPLVLTTVILAVVHVIL